MDYILDDLLISNQIKPLDMSIAQSIVDEVSKYVNIDECGTVITNYEFDELDAKYRVVIYLKAMRLAATKYLVDPNADAIAKNCGLFSRERAKYLASQFCKPDKHGNYWIV